jgi:endogenous inhibitor of DNA gyrase (YacG/DUF329 family)
MRRLFYHARRALAAIAAEQSCIGSKTRSLTRCGHIPYNRKRAYSIPPAGVPGVNGGCSMPNKKRVSSLRCPTCRKLVLRSDAEFPFCSERCRTIDLGKWASGAYVISTPINDPEAFDSQSGERSLNKPEGSDSDHLDGQYPDDSRKH